MQTYGLLYLFHLHPDIGNEDSGAVASYGILQDVGQFGLAVRDVVTVMFSQSQGDLF